MNALLFLAFTERYEGLMRDAPPEFRKWRLNADATPIELTEDVRAAILAYLNLCSGVYLWRNGYLDYAIWRVWNDEFERTLRSHLAQRGRRSGGKVQVLSRSFLRLRRPGSRQGCDAWHEVAERLSSDTLPQRRGSWQGSACRNSRAGRQAI